MQKFLRTLMLTAAMLLPFASHGQLNAIYQFSTGVDNSQWYTLTEDSVMLLDASSFTTSTTATTGDSKRTDVTNIGFTFNFAGTDYTQFSVNSDGTVRLGSTQITTSGYSNPFGSNLSSNLPKICGLGCDGCMVAGDYIAYQLFGTEGDHVLVIEISTGTYNADTRDHHYTFQVQLAEADNSVTLMYSPTAPAAGPATTYQLGAAASTTDIVTFNVADNTMSTLTASTSTTNASGTWPAPGRYYTITPDPNACFPVTALAVDATATTTSSLTLTWTDTSNTGATYSVYAINATDTTLLQGGLTTTTYTATGLTANTPYLFAVEANCSADNASVKTIVSGRTVCESTTALPYVEPFDGYADLPAYPYYGPSTIPGCWDFYSNGTNTAETTGTTAYYGGVGQYNGTSYGSMESDNPYLYMPIQITGSAVTSATYIGYEAARGNTKYAVMPAFAEALSGLQISFDYKMSTAYSATGAATVLELGYVTGDTSTFVSMQSWQAASTTQHVVDLNLSTLAAEAPAGARLAFKFSGVHNGTSTYSYTTVHLGIDNIHVETLPSCARVTNLTVAGVTSSTITLNWVDALNTGATYTVYDMADTSVVASGINDTTYTVTTLDANTQYTFAVVANCSATDASAEATVSGRTACAPYALPFTETFDATLASDQCWRGATNITFDSVLNGGVLNITNFSSWTYSSDVSNGLPAGHYRANIYGTSCRRWMITPEIDLGTASNPLLTFDAAFTAYTSTSSDPASGFESNTSQKFMILVSTNNGQTWNMVSDIPLTSLASSSYLTQYVNLSAYAGETVRVAFYAQSTTSGGDNNLHIDNISIDESTGDICYAPTNLTVSDITADGATLTWQGTADGYTIYNMADTTVEQYTTDTTVDLYALDAMTTYTFGVAANCGTEESQIVTVTFNTPCTALTLPYTETFETTSNARGCWSQEGSPSWTFATGDYSSSTGAYEGTLNAKISASDRVSVAKLISPVLDLDGANGVQLTFAHIQRAWSGDIDNLHVLYRTSAESAWVTAAEYTSEIASWTVDQVLLPASTYQVAFEFHSDYGYGVAIDSVVFAALTADYCAPVTGLTATGITADEASLTWTGDATSYNVYVISGTDTTYEANVTTGSYDLTGLTAMTTYTYGVRAVCGNSESDMVSVTFSTACAALTLPYTENFTETSATRNCWSFVNSNSANPVIFTNIDGHDVLRFSSYSTASDYNQYGFSPLMDVSSEATALQVNVTYATYGSSDNLYFGYATATDTVWDPTAYTTNGSSDFQTLTFVIPATATQLAVHYYGNYQYYAWIDSVRVVELTADYCYAPTNLTASGITAHEATLTWNGEGSSYSVYAVTATDTTLLQAVSDTTIDLTGLNGETQYTFGVANSCTNGESDTIYVTFTTLISCPAPTNLVATLTPGDGTVATVSWNAGGEETAWQVCLNGDMDNIINVSDSTYSFTGLTPEVADTVMVRAECSANDMSAWRTVVFTPTNAYSITVNDGTTTNNYVPIYGLYVDEITKSQFIIPATDLAAMQYGNITKLTFYASQENVNWGVATFNVYLTETTATGVSTLADYADMTQVYAGTLSIVNNKMEVTFTTPYQYMGGNLMVGFLQTVSGSFSSSYWYGVSATGASMGGYGSSISQRDFLPKTTIDYTPGVAPSCLPVSTLAVDSVTATSVSLSWTDEDNTGATYTVYNMADSSVVATGIVTTNYTVTGLTATTAYTFGVVANCSATDASLIRTVAATTDCLGGSCQITINGTDSYGDGWADLYGTAFSNITISQNGATVGTFTLTTGSSNTQTFSVCSGVPVTFTWNSNSDYDDEAAFEIVDGGNATVYTVSDASTLTDGAVFFTLADACPSCIAPAVTVDSASETTISISWTGTAASYDVYNGTTFVANVTTNNYTFTGLTAATAYTFGVQALCSATDSSSVATVNAMTACADITMLPYNEGFENGLGCWTTINGSADGQPWTINNCAGLTGITPHGGSYVASSWSWSSSAMHANAWLISPKFILPTVAAGDSLTLSWWERTNASYPDSYSMVLSTTTNDTAAFTTVIRPYGLADTTGDWALQTIDLTAYAGQSIYVAFHHVDYDENYLLIDDIALVEGGYVPPAPDTLTVTFAVNDATMGTTTPAPGTYQYLTGDTVHFSATQTAGNRFAYWLMTYGTNTDTITYQSAYATVSTFLAYWGNNITLTAYFEAGNPDSTTITYAVNDATMGTINPTGTHTIYVGDAISAEATANTGYALTAWVFDIYLGTTLYNSDTITTDDADFANPMLFGTLPQSFPDNNASIVVTAIFAADSTPVTYYTVTLGVNDEDMGSVNQGGSIAEGTSFTAVASPTAGYHFVAWKDVDGNVVSNDNPYTFTVTADVTLIAYFEVSSAETVNVNVNWDQTMGSVTGFGTFEVGDEVTLTATALEGYSFVGWMIDEEVVSAQNPYTFIATTDVTFTAVFRANDGIESAELDGVSIYSTDSRIVVAGAEGRSVTIYDVTGRPVSRQAEASAMVEFTMQSSGAYLVKVGNAPAKRVVVLR